MSKDHLERRTYRKSPGRQYGYDYDPLRSQSGVSGEGSYKSQSGASASRSGAILANRPDARRTRQLMRQSIIASKRGNDEDAERMEFSDQEYSEQHDNPVPARASRRHVLHRESPEPRSARITSQVIEPDQPRRSRRYAATGSIGRHRTLHEPQLPPNNALLVSESGYAEQWHDLASVDPDLRREEKLSAHPDDRYDNETFDYEDAYAYDLAARYDQDESPARPSRSSTVARERSPELHEEIYEPELDSSARLYTDEDADYDYEYEYEEDRASVSRSRKRKKSSLLFGAGIVAAGAAGVAVYEAVPKIPQAVGNVEQQVQDAFNRGVTQGANQARKELIDGLESIEGYTLDGAIGAAYLTRIAYDVFVSPVVHFGSVLTGNFLNGMLSAFKTARGLLAGIYQDNATLVAIQKVLESWVSQVNQLPKQLDAITDADLDGAQAYLRALQRQINTEKAQLNNPKATPAAQPKATPTPSAKKPGQ
jgi:hypothetical protein